MSRFIRTLLVLSTLVVLAFGHSQLRCAKYNKATGACAAPIRNQGVSFIQEAHTLASGGICQSPMANPLTASYGNGADCPDWAPCPAPMGTFAPGEKFTIMWLARNHAVDNQNPGSIQLYMSPREQVNQGSDVSADKMKENLICSGAYMSCGGVNQDMTPCTLDCTMPTNTAAGYYTFWWKWDWQGGVTYTTCADILVTGNSSPSVPSPANPLTTGRITPATTGQTRALTTGSRPLTTGARSNPSPASTTASRTTTARASSTPVTTKAISVPSGNAPCTLGHMRCTPDNNQFQTCGWSTATLTDWGTPQNCPSGLKCHPVQGNYVWCY